ncbi:MAG: SAM-dependent chlorinase/fluorinase [Bacteroidetes bacterium]|nr:SAM-dependent chlorinase/fluorinase [Bacteroidota bacterium]
MAIITLTTDFGLKDHYVGSVKGAILKQLPTATIIDISHQIEKFNIQDAAFILKETYSDFPENSVHIIGLLTEFRNTGGYIAVQNKGHFFIGADSGIFSLLFEEPPEKIIEIPVEPSQNLSFPVRDIFVPIACMLASEVDIEAIGKSKQNLLQRLPFRASSMGNIIRGSIVFVDSYGNVITNIDRKLFNMIGKGQPFIIELARSNQIERLSAEYNEVAEGEILALFNSSNNLEIAMRNGKISSMLNLKLNDSITIRF